LKQKFYVVWEGHRPGIYSNWEECKKQVEGFPQAKYKAFDDRVAAEAAMKENYWKYIQKNSVSAKRKPLVSKSQIIQQSLAVDAACSGNPGDMEYRGVWVADGRQIFHVGPLEDGTNNIGEFLAIVHALAYFRQQGRPDTPIYSDSVTAQGWVKKGKCNTKLEPTGQNDRIFELIERAEKWLATYPVTNPVLKWETEAWGEIPADFGRKG
jgi:ribonuclease HI